MEDPTKDTFSSEVHIEMWKHYDNLRQAKNGTFLTANSILVAIGGFVFNESPELVLAISLLGIVIGVSWFLLLTRNAAYINYHRKQVGKGAVEFWKPKTWTPSSNNLERTLAASFTIFWLVLLVSSCG
jgi:hypothetical protein